MPTSYALTVYQDKAKFYRWRITHKNGSVLCDSGEGYSTHSNAVRAARRLRLIAWTARLVA
jgi:uncharacterized protein YegP (UPF0339 family)